MNNITNHIKNNYRIFYIITGLCGLLLLWWIGGIFGLVDFLPHIWAESYQVMALIGGVFGIISSLRWGGHKSLLGRAIMFFAVGLLLQVFGQSVFGFYNLYLHVPVPYPSIADIGFFGSVIMYIYGSYLLFKVSGGIFSLRNNYNKLIVLFLPLLALAISYYYFIGSAGLETTFSVKTLFDFGYPLGQALYVSMAVITLIMSKKYLGGVMKWSVLVLLAALLTQYLADYNFLYQALHGTWEYSGYGDVLYLIAYYVMALALIMFGRAYSRLKNS